VRLRLTFISWANRQEGNFSYQKHKPLNAAREIKRTCASSPKSEALSASEAKLLPKNYDLASKTARCRWDELDELDECVGCVGGGEKFFPEPS